MRRIFVLAIVALFLAAAMPALAEDLCGSPVVTKEGLVKGKPDQASCSWKAVPYAAPPVGKLRWRAPQPALTHSAALEAYQLGVSCPAKESLTSGGESVGFGEDCLTLNIWRPNKSGVFPVMFWIHGGGFTQGSGAYALYNGARLAAERDLVVVTINYRLGALGFLALPELAAEDENKSTGNYGLMDQIQALQWVRDNIAGFGGDPGNVTIFGQSAGGISVCALMASPPAAGLFHRAINMSGPCDMVAGMEDGYKQGQAIAAAAKCEGAGALDCLRRKPVDALVVSGGNDLLNGGISFSPHLDGYIVPGQPLDLIREGKFNRTPLMIGSTKDEIKLFAIAIPGLDLMPRFKITWLLRKLTGPLADEVLKMYSYSDYRRPSDLFMAAACDLAFTSRVFAQAEAAAGQVPTFLYRFEWNRTRAPNKMGAFHGLDVPFVFATFNQNFRLAKILASKKSIAQGQPLSEQMMSYFANFARTGDPNGANLPAWPAYTSAQKERLIFNTPISLRPLTAKEVERYTYLRQHKLSEISIGKNKEK